MPVTINGSGSIAGLSVGGLGNGGIVDADSLASNAVTSAKIASNAITPSVMPTGSIIQVVQGTTHGTNNYSNVNFENTVISTAITPVHANSKFLIESVVHFGIGSEDCATSFNFSDSLHASGTTHPLGPMSTDGNNGSAGQRLMAFFGSGSFAADSSIDDFFIGNVSGKYLYTPAYQNTNSRTFAVMVRSAEGINVRLNMNAHYNAANPRDMRPTSSITVYEVKA